MMSDPINWQSCPSELLLCLFSFYDIPTLGRINLVCKRWREHANDSSLWRDLTRIRYGENGKQTFSYFVHAHKFTWKEAFRLGAAPFLDFCLKVLGQKLGVPKDHVANNPLQSQLFPEQSLPTPFVAYGGYHFSIINSIDIAQYNPETKLTELLQGKPKALLTHLQAEGDFVFSLDRQGTIVQWNFAKKERVATFTVKCPSGVFKNCFLVQDQTLFIKPHDISTLHVIPYNQAQSAYSIPLLCDMIALDDMVKEGSRLYLQYSTTIVICDLVTKTAAPLFSIIEPEIITCIAPSAKKLCVVQGHQLVIHENPSAQLSHESSSTVYNITSLPAQCTLLTPELLLCAYGTNLQCCNLSTLQISPVADIYDPEAKMLRPDVLKTLIAMWKLPRD